MEQLTTLVGSPTVHVTVRQWKVSTFTWTLAESENMLNLRIKICNSEI